MNERRNYPRYSRQQMQPAARMQCGDNTVIEEIPAYSLAMVYAPRQSFSNIYDDRSALPAGTLYKELNLPFSPCGRNRNG